MVFIPKYRRKVIRGELRKEIGAILGRLCEMKDLELLEGHASQIIYIYWLKFLRNYPYHNSLDI